MEKEFIDVPLDEIEEADCGSLSQMCRNTFNGESCKIRCRNEKVYFYGCLKRY
jgi:hypothetical protein